MVRVAIAAKPGTHAGIPGVGSSQVNLLTLLESVLSGSALVGSLWTQAVWLDHGISMAFLLLGVVAFSLTYPSKPRLHLGTTRVMLDILLNWMWVVAMLTFCVWVTHYTYVFPVNVLLHWLWLAPVTEAVGYQLLKAIAPSLIALNGAQQRAVVAGMNEQSVALATHLDRSPYAHVNIIGFVGSRDRERLPDCKYPLLGHLSQLADIAKSQRVQQIYISMPMATQPRVLKLLDTLKDTTASIYFVPDIFVTDQIQSHIADTGGIPVISVCDTLFRGLDDLVKRLSDIVFAIAVLLFTSPLLLAIAIAVKYSSPGPVLFKQRRYDLAGEEILVYKFHSMRVNEDGDWVAQATRSDTRVTRVGVFLRKTSLDELPLFINVLQGRMSTVGPRPHTVAHNELYRKLIKGYMVRHKVKPGITGWAQVNGFRGETDTLEKMSGRIDHDLDYLRNWSLKLDILIVLKTIKLVFKDRMAY